MADNRIPSVSTAFTNDFCNRSPDMKNNFESVDDGHAQLVTDIKITLTSNKALKMHVKKHRNYVK
jgi:hypothetical protein